MKLEPLYTIRPTTADRLNNLVEVCRNATDKEIKSSFKELSVTDFNTIIAGLNGIYYYMDDTAKRSKEQKHGLSVLKLATMKSFIDPYIEIMLPFAKLVGVEKDTLTEHLESSSTTPHNFVLFSLKTIRGNLFSPVTEKVRNKFVDKNYAMAVVATIKLLVQYTSMVESYRILTAKLGHPPTVEQMATELEPINKTDVKLLVDDLYSPFLAMGSPSFNYFLQKV